MKSLGFVILWGITLVQSANAFFFCLRTNPCWGGKSSSNLPRCWRAGPTDFLKCSIGRCWRFARLPEPPACHCDAACRVRRPAPSPRDAELHAKTADTAPRPKTVTAVVSAVNTVTVTTSTTATVATTRLLFTESTTTTASTATSIALQTTTVLVTSTDVQTAPPHHFHHDRV